MPAAKDGLNPEDRKVLGSLRDQFPAGFLVKIGAMRPGLALPESIMADPTTALHRCAGKDLDNLESWLMSRPGVVGGGEYSIQLWPDKGDGRVRGQAKLHFPLKLPSIVDQARVAHEGRAAILAVGVEQKRNEAQDALAAVNSAARAAEKAMAEEAKVLAAAQQNPTGADPASIAAAMRNSAEAQAALAQNLGRFETATAAMQNMLSRATAAPAAPAAAPAPAGQQPVYMYPQPGGGWAPQPSTGGVPGTPGGVLPNPLAPRVIPGHGTLYADGTFVANSEAGGGGLRDELKQMREKNEGALAAMQKALDDEREARREAQRAADTKVAEAQRLADAAKQDAERREQAARHEADMKALRDDLRRMAEDGKRAVDEAGKKKDDGGSAIDKLIPILLSGKDDTLKLVTEMQRQATEAGARLQEKYIELMRESKDPDYADHVKKMGDAMGTVMNIQQSMMMQALRAATQQSDSKKPDVWLTLAEKVGEPLQAIAQGLMGGSTARADVPQPLPEPAPRELPPARSEPARSAAALPAAPPPSAAQVLVESARAKARAGRVQEALETLDFALREDPALHRDEQPDVVIRRLLEGCPAEHVTEIVRLMEAGLAAARARQQQPAQQEAQQQAQRQAQQQAVAMEPPPAATVAPAQA